MGTLKATLQADLVTAMKAHDELGKSTLRMALAAITNEEVAGTAARELSPTEEQAVLTREVARRKDSAEAYRAGNRPELAEKELAEAAILAAYLPEPLAEAELRAIIDEEIAALTGSLGGPLTLRHLGQVMKAVGARVAGRAEGAVVAALVKAALA